MSKTSEQHQRAMGLLVNIDVDDLERGVRFYTEGLGLSVGRRFQERWIELVGASSAIYLLEKKAGTPTDGWRSSRTRLATGCV